MKNFVMLMILVFLAACTVRTPLNPSENEYRYAGQKRHEVVIGKQFNF